MIDLEISAVLLGKAAPFGPPGRASAIHKTPVDGPRAVGPNGFLDDEQADRRVHGGPDKAIHHYPMDHGAAWRADLGDDVPFLGTPGAFGENLSTTGITEADICLGDRLRAGTALLEVASGRQPCWKLNHRFGVPDMAKRVQNTARTGWYYRVIEDGAIGSGDRLTLVDRPCPGWPLIRLLRVLYVDTMDRAALAEMAALPALAQSWRVLAERRLERSAVEDWSGRLNGG
ncbi:MOSC domain-containing protein [Azospirillum doebereinerae]|uniref:MOSC domain-containing protein n=1 Tax=Azospirillum doebereinerae TaxID=92933 RepID=UPI001EE50263|nr:MOSC domain-containing protein [Azospirillum doebereinerae]MCG5239274.1 MOSC domain-containing protein [Azospirillum doebereinerae]